MTINPIRTAAGVLAVGAALLATPTTASAESPTPIATTGSADSGSAGPGSIICWLLHPSTTCQL